MPKTVSDIEYLVYRKKDSHTFLQMLDNEVEYTPADLNDIFAYCVCKGDVQMVRKLLKRGALYNNTVIIDAIKSRVQAMLEVLLESYDNYHNDLSAAIQMAIYVDDPMMLRILQDRCNPLPRPDKMLVQSRRMCREVCSIWPYYSSRPDDLLFGALIANTYDAALINDLIDSVVAAPNSRKVLTEALIICAKHNKSRYIHHLLSRDIDTEMLSSCANTKAGRAIKYAVSIRETMSSASFDFLDE